MTYQLQLIPGNPRDPRKQDRPHRRLDLQERQDDPLQQRDGRVGRGAARDCETAQAHRLRRDPGPEPDLGLLPRPAVGLGLDADGDGLVAQRNRDGVVDRRGRVRDDGGDTARERVPVRVPQVARLVRIWVVIVVAVGAQADGEVDHLGLRDEAGRVGGHPLRVDLDAGAGWVGCQYWTRGNKLGCP